MFFDLVNEQSNLVVNSSIVKRFMKVIFHIKPALPKHNNVWDVSVVLDYLEILMPLHTISLRLFSYKLVTLLALLLGQRSQTLQLIYIRNAQFNSFGVKNYFGDMMKQTCLYHLTPLELSILEMKACVF